MHIRTFESKHSHLVVEKTEKQLTNVGYLFVRCCGKRFYVNHLIQTSKKSVPLFFLNFLNEGKKFRQFSCSCLGNYNVEGSNEFLTWSASWQSLFSNHLELWGKQREPLMGQGHSNQVFDIHVCIFRVLCVFLDSRNHSTWIWFLTPSNRIYEKIITHITTITVSHQILTLLMNRTDHQH